MSADFPSWSETALWRAIESRTGPIDKKIISALNLMMPDIQSVLMDGSPATRDFTLHDHGHAFRVAERMQEIVGDRLLEQLSTYELAFLLLSAYLHDIGMAPAQKKVERHRRHILFGDDKKPDKLSEDEALAFREFYDSSDWNAPVPFAPEGGADEVAIQSANEVLTD
jgi:hypothetical protein